jgi:hypothetical protein
VGAEPRPLRSPLIGSATRAAADDAQADTMRKLAATIKPGVSIRIERSRPTWAAGWIEDYATDGVGDALQDLYEHLRDEHGGQLYRLTVLAPGEHPVYVGAVPIAGPVRVEGKKVGRAEFELSAQPPAPAQRAQNPQPDNGSAMLASMGQFMGLLMQSQEKAAQLQIEAVRDMVRSSQKQGSDLAAALLQIRHDEHERRGLASQVGELIESMSAFDEVRKRLGGGARSSSGDAENPDELQGALGEAMKHFFGNVMQSMASRRPAPGTRVSRRVVRRTPPGAPVVGEQLPDLPDAIPGQHAPSN